MPYTPCPSRHAGDYFTEQADAEAYEEYLCSRYNEEREELTITITELNGRYGWQVKRGSLFLEEVLAGRYEDREEAESDADGTAEWYARKASGYEGVVG